MAILTQAGRKAIASSVKTQEIFLAWGTGDETWDVVPPQAGLVESTELICEVGRRICENVEFCYADPAGLIITPDGRYSASAEPTNMLHFSVQFDFEDAVGLTIREFGLFLNTVTVAGLPVGQKYFTPDQITDKGLLLCAERCGPIYRQIMSREGENFVIQF